MYLSNYNSVGEFNQFKSSKFQNLLGLFESFLSLLSTFIIRVNRFLSLIIVDQNRERKNESGRVQSMLG